MQTTGLTALSADVAAIAAQASQSTAALRHRGRWFSGFYWRPDVIATAAELVQAKQGETIAVLTPSQETLEGVLIGQDPATDLALIRVRSAAQAVSAPRTARLALGDAVLAAGRTRSGPTCALGFVALAGEAWESLRGGEISARVWLDMRLPSQSEGSVVFDARAVFIGMAVYGPRRRILLIPAETIERVGQELLTHGHIRRGYLGVAIQPVTIQPGSEGAANKTGLMVVSLDPAGPAVQAGLRQGDIVIAFDGKVAESARGLVRMLRRTSPGKGVQLDVLRSGQKVGVSVALAEGPTA
jgi:S1-C subfamily serine protease